MTLLLAAAIARGDIRPLPAADPHDEDAIDASAMVAVLLGLFGWRFRPRAEVTP